MVPICRAHLVTNPSCLDACAVVNGRPAMQEQPRTAASFRLTFATSYYHGQKRNIVTDPKATRIGPDQLSRLAMHVD